MSNKILDLSKWRHAVLFAAILAFAAQSATAGRTPAVTATYDVVQEINQGSVEQVRIRIHLVNRGSSALSIRRIALWNSPHPEKAGAHVCSLALGAHASIDTTQEFTVRHADYERWTRGAPPHLALELVGPGNFKSETLVRLNRISGQEVQ